MKIATNASNAAIVIFTYTFVNDSDGERHSAGGLALPSS